MPSQILGNYDCKIDFFQMQYTCSKNFLFLLKKKDFECLICSLTPTVKRWGHVRMGSDLTRMFVGKPLGCCLPVFSTHYWPSYSSWISERRLKKVPKRTVPDKGLTMGQLTYEVDTLPTHLSGEHWHSDYKLFNVTVQILLDTLLMHKAIMAHEHI